MFHADMTVSAGEQQQKEVEEEEAAAVSVPNGSALVPE